MRRAILAIASTVAGLVLLLTFKTHTTTAQSTAAATAASSSATTTTTTATTRTVATGTRTVTGDAEQNQYGAVQVQITVKNGKMIAVSAPQYPSGDGRSQQINAYAIPTLNQEALRAGSASINMVSGATYTSDSYLASLQTALTKAGLA